MRTRAIPEHLRGVFTTRRYTNPRLPYVYLILILLRDVMQRGAKLDKPMADGRTSLIKAMEGNDMPMIDTLLGADKNQNFSDKNSFMYQMVELYQREDRGIS